MSDEQMLSKRERKIRQRREGVVFQTNSVCAPGVTAVSKQPGSEKKLKGHRLSTAPIGQPYLDMSRPTFNSNCEERFVTGRRPRRPRARWTACAHAWRRRPSRSCLASRQAARTAPRTACRRGARPPAVRGGRRGGGAGKWGSAARASGSGRRTMTHSALRTPTRHAARRSGPPARVSEI